MGGQHEQEGGVIPGGHEGREKDGVWRFGGPCLVSGRHEEAERERKAKINKEKMAVLCLLQPLSKIVEILTDDGDIIGKSS